MDVVPKRLRTLRAERQLSRRELSRLASISEKQLQRLESPDRPPGAVRAATVARLATALGVVAEELTGEAPTQHNSKPARMTAAMLPGVRLAYDLVERRYGLTASQLVNAAPLFFTFLAEGCLAWRRDVVAEVREMQSRLREVGGPRHQRYGYYARELENGSDQEELAIARSDLFGEPLDEDYDQLDALDELRQNPFADYLAKLADELGVQAQIEIDPSQHGRVASLPCVPGYRVCGEDLSDIARLDSDAAYALQVGDVRLSEIPDELAGADKDEDRLEWLEGRLSSESRKWLDDRQSRPQPHTGNPSDPDPAAGL